MTSIIPPSQFPNLFVNDTPLLDVRAPVEVSKGSFPTSTNIALINDEQRRLIGIDYKQHGHESAVALGHELIAPNDRQQLLERWLDYIANHQGAALYCYRGGQRSQFSQQWLADAGCSVPRIDGGYKALRNYLLGVLEQVAANTQLLIAGGKTGSGKTHLINALPFSVDLEGRANHRGSAFGLRTSPQPTQIDFENALAVDFIKLPLPSINRVILEDESHSIGSLHLPRSLYSKMSEAPLAIIEVPFAARVTTIFNDYILSNYTDFLSLDRQNAPDLFSQSLLDSLAKIQRRLGGELHQEIEKIMHQALRAQFSSNDSSGHRQWIDLLLQKYYDPMYEYQLAKKHHRIIFRGDSDEFLRWATSLNNKST
ncbi:MAG: tRNA 2-selenouridine synthase [Pseudohongiellaceae bacterium]|jgi:tRNA 2-selenouridine synthase